MELAFETLIGQGVLGVFLVLVIVYFRKKENDYKEIIKEKDDKIEKCNEQARLDAIETIGFVKDLQATIKELIIELRK